MVERRAFPPGDPTVGRARGPSLHSVLDNCQTNCQTTRGTMIEASVNWTDNDRFVGAATSRHSIVMDAAAEKTANSPMELVLLSLCGCTASDVVGILRKKREKFTGLEVTAKAERAEGHPAV